MDHCTKNSEKLLDQMCTVCSCKMTRLREWILRSYLWVVNKFLVRIRHPRRLQPCSDDVGLVEADEGLRDVIGPGSHHASKTKVFFILAVIQWGNLESQIMSS